MNYINGILVTFENPVSDDYANKIAESLKLLNAVLFVEPVPDNVEAQIAFRRARRELGDKLFEVLYPEKYV